MTKANYTIQIVDDELHSAVGTVYIHYKFTVQGKERDVKTHIFSGPWAGAVRAALDLHEEGGAPITIK